MKLHTCLVMLLTGATSFAQQSHFFVIAGPMKAVENPFTRFEGDLVQVAGGGEGHIGPYFAINGEASGLFSVNNRLGGRLFVGALGPSVHPLGRRIARFDPFFTVGPAIALGDGNAGLVYVGGGANIWLSRHVGIRVDIRDHIPITTDRVHLIGFRFGIALR